MKGRKPGESLVVPLRDDGLAGHNLSERAFARATALRPEGLLDAELWVYNRVAPPLCHPTKDRLNEANIYMFIQLVRSIVRYEAYMVTLAELGETYVVSSRNGNQQKSRPEVAQLNETWRQIRALASDFGMTPAAERAVKSGPQIGFDFGEGANDFT